MFADWSVLRRLTAISALIERSRCERWASVHYAHSNTDAFEQARSFAYVLNRVLFDVQSNQVVPVE